MISTNVEELADMQRLQPGTLGRILFWEQGHFGETAGITVTVRTYDTSEEVDVYYAGGGIIGMLCNNTGSLSNFCVDDMDFRSLKNAEILPEMYRRCLHEQTA